jgi:hypothetical protein
VARDCHGESRLVVGNNKHTDIARRESSVCMKGPLPHLGEKLIAVLKIFKDVQSNLENVLKSNPKTNMALR